MNESFKLINRWYSYDIAKSEWINLDTLPGEARQYASSFSSNNCGFIVGGILSGSRFSNECFLFDPAVLKWEKLNNAPWQPRGAAAVFTIGKYAYLAGGRNDSVHFNDLWRFNIETHHWDSMGVIPGLGKDEMVGFGMTGYGYLMLGRERNGQSSNEVWKYDVLNDSWTEMNDFPGRARSHAAGSSADYGAMVVGGQDDDANLLSEVYYYKADEDSWLKLPALSNELRGAEALRVGEEFFLLCGLTHNFPRLNEVVRISLSESVDQNSSPFVVYPNRNNGVVAVSTKTIELIQAIHVFNAHGRLVRSIENDSSLDFTVLNLQGIGNGLFYMNILGENKSQNIKIIIL